jgi:hypothetical protein
VYLSNAILIATAVVTAALVGKGWSWWLFIWGAGLGVLGLAGNELIVRVMVRMARPVPSDLERLRSRRHDQRLIVFPSALLTGCAIGIIAAGLLVHICLAAQRLASNPQPIRHETEVGNTDPELKPTHIPVVSHGSKQLDRAAPDVEPGQPLTASDEGDQRVGSLAVFLGDRLALV